ncbi:hypothetical protein PSPO01_08990 [Paraphaeosphaeria sporulosa]
MRLGFVVYRLTYENDYKWARFMDHLNTRTRLNLEKNGAGDLFPRIDWSVQEDPALEDADYDEVRKRFNRWVRDQSEDKEREPFSTRHLACVAVPMFHIDCVLKGPKPTQNDSLGYGWVALIRAEIEEDGEGCTQVGVSFLVPRAFSVLEIGWHAVDVGTQDVYAG